MNAIVTQSIIVICCGALAALMVSFGMAGAVQLTSRRTTGYMHLVFYGMLLTVALDGLLSGRSLTSSALSFVETTVEGRHPVMVWVQPVISLLMLMIAGERIITRFFRPQAAPVPLLLLAAFIVFWMGTVASPAFFGAHSFVTHDYAYSLVIGIAVLLASEKELALSFRAARDSLFIFMLAGLLVIPFKPELVMDTAYSQGLLPGVPRLAGLAAHAVSLGILAQLGLLCLIASPYSRRWLNRLAWVIGLGVLFFAQSKTAWVSFALCCACIYMVRRAPGFARRMVDPVRKEFGVVVVVGIMAAVVLASVVLMFAGLDAKLSAFFDSAEGAQITSLTGRDLIWSIAYDEWLRNPIFGYGPKLWDADFRAAIHMANASHGHNQFMDTLSRSGLVGAAALVLYSIVLLALSVRYAQASRGLTLALFLAVALRSISEVPLLLFGYGSELMTHLLLLMTLASVAGTRSAAAVAKAATARPTFTPPGNRLATASPNP